MWMFNDRTRVMCATFLVAMIGLAVPAGAGQGSRSRGATHRYYCYKVWGNSGVVPPNRLPKRLDPSFGFPVYYMTVSDSVFAAWIVHSPKIAKLNVILN